MLLGCKTTTTKQDRQVESVSLLYGDCDILCHSAWSGTDKTKPTTISVGTLPQIKTTHELINVSGLLGRKTRK